MESMSLIALPTLLRSHSLRRRLRRTLFSQLIHSRSAVPLVTVVAVSCPRCLRCECTIKLFTNCVFDCVASLSSSFSAANNKNKP